MTSYVAMRTDARVPDYIRSELLAGRLRQGWGYEPNQDLRMVQSTARPKRDEHQQAAWRNRRLLEETGDGLQTGDIIVFPNIPRPGCWAFARITGPYRYEIDLEQGDYGHIRSVDPILAADGDLAWIVPNHELVSAPLRRSMTCRSRMWSLDAFGNEIERILAALAEGRRPLTRSQTPDERYGRFVGSVRSEAFRLVEHGWGAAELEGLVERILRHRYQASHPNTRVERKGGPSEHGIDILVTLPDPLGVSLKIGVQVKQHDGEETSLRSLEQIADARDHWGIHAGIVLTTATEISEAYEAHREALSEKLGIDIQVLCREQFVDLVLEYVAAESRTG